MKMNDDRSKLPCRNQLLFQIGRAGLLVLTALCALVLGGCDYDVPITAKPTGKLEKRLVGNWTSSDGKEKMKVRPWDESFYVVVYNDTLVRAYPSDVGSLTLVSAQELDSGKGKYSFLTWRLSEDGKQLRMRSVNEKIIPFDTPTPEAVQKLLKQNAQNPDLFHEEALFTRDPD